MRIAQLSSNYHSIPSGNTGAIAQVVDQLTNGLIDQGHEVTLFASGDSRTKARLVAVAEKKISELSLPESTVRHYIHALVARCYELADQFDLIHSHFNVASAFYSGLISAPIVQTMHGSINDDMRAILQNFKQLNYISFSLSQRQQMPELNWVANIYHGVNTQQFAFQDSPQDYFLFIGPLCAESGTHLAIEAAQAAKVKLFLAGRSCGDDNYWHEVIEPLVDGEQVRYVGNVENGDKVELFRGAKALLFPAQWDEPFGLVPIEAMSCGTPVIAFDRGSVSEILQDGETGFIVQDVAGMTKALDQVDRISRLACRERTERLFSVEKMISGYENVYARLAG